MQITAHLSQPNGTPQLALTFQPLVNMALSLQLAAWQGPAGDEGATLPNSETSKQAGEPSLLGPTAPSALAEPLKQARSEAHKVAALLEQE